jgi:hypothetical protein
MTKKNIWCGFVELGRTMALLAQGWRGFDGIAGSGHRGLREDNDTVGSGTAWVISIVGSRTAWGAHRCRLREDDIGVGLGTTLQAWECGLRGRWRHQLGDDGAARSREDSTTARRLWGGLDNGIGSEEVNNGAGSKEIFGRKVWQPDSVSESLRGLGFTNDTQWFIYTGTTVATGISDVIRAVATENHSSAGCCHHQTIANVICISIAPSWSSTHK